MMMMMTTTRAGLNSRRKNIYTCHVRRSVFLAILRIGQNDLHEQIINSTKQISNFVVVVFIQAATTKTVKVAVVLVDDSSTIYFLRTYCRRRGREF